MDKKLQNQLFKKYPLLFKRSSSPQTPFDAYGIECGDGWCGLLDKLCSRISCHIENPEWELNFSNKLKKAYNLSIWNYVIYPIISKLPYSIYSKLQNKLCANVIYSPPKENKLEKFKFVQIKEKFSSVCIHTSNSDSYIDGLISLAESMSYSICEKCGTNQDVSQNQKGWIKTYCKKCRNGK